MSSSITIFSTVIIFGVVFLIGGTILFLKTGGSPWAYFEAQLSSNDRQNAGGGTQPSTSDTTTETIDSNIAAATTETSTQTETTTGGDIHSVATGDTTTTSSQPNGTGSDVTTNGAIGTQTETNTNTESEDEDSDDSDDFGIDDGRGDEYSMYDEDMTDDNNEWVDHDYSESNMTDTALDDDTLTGVDTDIHTSTDSTDTDY